MSGLVASLTFALSAPASADLIMPDPARAYPDVAADVNGVVNYTYDPSTQTGDFHVTNTPYLLAGGPTTDAEFNVMPNSNGIRQQIVNIALDQNGNFVSNPGNSYELWGTVTAGGQTYSGLLLKGVPTAFGSQYRPPTGSQGSAIFDMNINVTGGALASAFGRDVYMSIQPELQISFDGNFNKNFSAAKATSNTRAYHAPLPFPAPEPTTMAILLAGGTFGILYRARKRAPR
jgi:hypothetical protein